jgi:T6SS, Phospholipase effector Tle1-like, catalytic domain
VHLVGKSIVVCLDGTGNQLKARGSTNVVRFFELLELGDPAAQVAYYDPGVGTFSAHGAWTPAARSISRVLGLAIGSGMRENLGEAYRYLLGAWEPGDRLSIFGFSRGAFTARALAGMLYRVGLLRPGCENLVQYAVNVYARNRGRDADLSGDEGWKRIDRFSAAFARTTNRSRAVPITFMGIWDSVKAASIFGRDLAWPYTRQLPNVATVWHAVSIDEQRRPYREYLVEPKGDRPVLNETWFAGVHSDVGAPSRTTRGWPTSPSSGWPRGPWPPASWSSPGPTGSGARSPPSMRWGGSTVWGGSGRWPATAPAPSPRGPGCMPACATAWRRSRPTGAASPARWCGRTSPGAICSPSRAPAPRSEP